MESGQVSNQNDAGTVSGAKQHVEEVDGVSTETPRSDFLARFAETSPSLDQLLVPNPSSDDPVVAFFNRLDRF